MVETSTIRPKTWLIPLLMAGLCAVGLSGIWRAEELSGGSGKFFYRQLIWAIVCVAAFIAGSRLRYVRWLRWSYVLLAVGILTLGLVYLFPPIHGARRWLRLGTLAVQPSEFAKLAVVLALARHIVHRRHLGQGLGLPVPLLLVALPVLLIFKEPDLGTALVFLPVLFAMLFTAGMSWRQLGFGMLVGVAFLPTLRTQMSREQVSRITALFEQAGPNELVSDDAFHLFQSEQMIALGSWWGSFATGEDPIDPTVYRLPEPHTDSIISILAEKHGIAGIVFALALYAALIKQILQVASGTHEIFGRSVAVGIAAMIGAQVVINVGMMVGLLPITGLALPLVSYGGSNLVATGLGLGIVCNISHLSGVKKLEPFEQSSEHS